ncbi:MAG: hypothetical protein K5981_06465, partial [Clostridia bacterium]|nr:hypothetical protein [Clostridia bacterium]
QYGRGEQADEIVWESGWRGDGIRIRDMRPMMWCQTWGYASMEEGAPLQCFNATFGEEGMWASYSPRHLAFSLVETPGDSDYIKSGIVSSDEGIVSLEYNDDLDLWDVSVHGYGWVVLSWTDPTDNEVYIFRIFGSEPDGFYDDPNRYLDCYYGYGGIEDEPVDYTVGEGKSLYFSDLKYYDNGIDAVTIVGENPMGVAAAEVAEAEDDTLWAITVPESASGDFSVTVHITYHLSDEDIAYVDAHPEEYPDGYYDEYTIRFHGVPQATRKLRGEDGYAEVIVNKDSGAFDVGGASAQAPVLVASYDADGRFLGLVVADKGFANGVAEENASEVELFWIDETFSPKAEDAEVGLN